MTPEERELIRGRVPLEELAQRYDLHLTPDRGGRKLKALCPFHQEKTPSFAIDVEKQLYYCFGCEAGGDVFRFVQEMDRVSFVEAVEILARMAGVILDRRPGAQEQTRKRLGLFDALEFAAEYYRRVLLEDSQSAAAREYVDRRGIQREVQERFRIGFSPVGWDGLFQAATRAGHSPEALVQAGLARPRQEGNGYYDYFRGRVMFPIADAQGRVIGFGARTLGDDQPKYLNTPATPLFDKSQVLYGISQCRTGIRREEAIAVVEGYTDAIMAHQAGLDFFVASLGTAFTTENARSLRRLAPRVYMIFDGDKAGQTAAERSLDLLVGEDLEVRVYSVVDGKDPCDAILARGAESFRRSLLEDSVDLFEFKWRVTAGSREASASAQSRARAVESFLELVGGVRNEVTRRLILREYTERLGLRENDVEKMLGDAVRRRASRPRESQRPQDQQRHAATAAGFGPQRARDAQEFNRAGVNGASAALTEDASGSTNRPVAPLEPLAELALRCLLALPDQAPSIWERVPEALFTGPVGEALRQAVLDQLRSATERGCPFSGVELAQNLHEPEANRVVIKLLSCLEAEDETLKTDYPALWTSCQRDLRRWEIQTSIAKLEAQLRQEKEAVRSAAVDANVTSDASRENLRREITRMRKELKKR